MAKGTGIGSALWVDQYVLSNDFRNVETNGGPALLDVTGIDSPAHERIGGVRDGRIAGTAYLNDATDRAHPVLSQLPTADTILSYAESDDAVGDRAASLVAKQIGYDGDRAEDGMLTFDVEALSSTLGLAWGRLGTPGVTTETSTSNQASIDNAAASSNGLRAFLHVTAFTGTNCTIEVQESSDDGAGDAFAAIGTFTSVTAVGAEAIEVTGAVERYLRVAITGGTFSSITFAVNIARL